MLQTENKLNPSLDDSKNSLPDDSFVRHKSVSKTNVSYLFIVHSRVLENQAEIEEFLINFRLNPHLYIS